ncbi:translocation protein YopX [Yersinia pestis]|uniref:Yop proteins translocation protein X n=15 Tax=Yersinia TaxID=629 RepID=YSCX_YERPE|nr:MULTISPECIES: type III secretion system protein YscX [Yersinia]A1JU78.1 RecName: Full=Yop proteins translocation protein X [Yersinia enterocolitica subsp. enterocolitica 8081]P61416.1 RecName: Full=Yop proteins translocation protein X [Yersinia pestis]EDR30634.1 type III secretion protein YscX [Yersinia pestis biovar Orientalis str. IP275]EFA45636.1 type III secretion protein, YscX family [Yersinia pestis KIM D27]ETO48914.1 preprotein translocase X [Yersinia pestis S3]CQD58687.1 putative t
MSRIITAPHIGIEKLSAISLEELSCGLPERYALPPDGHPVEPHLERLYPTAQSKRSLWDFASPGYTFHGLHRAQDYRRELDTLQSLLTTSQSSELQAAAALLKCQQDDDRLLQIILNLLHKV